MDAGTGVPVLIISDLRNGLNKYIYRSRIRECASGHNDKNVDQQPVLSMNIKIHILAPSLVKGFNLQLTIPHYISITGCL